MDNEIFCCKEEKNPSFPLLINVTRRSQRGIVLLLKKMLVAKLFEMMMSPLQCSKSCSTSFFCTHTSKIISVDKVPLEKYKWQALALIILGFPFRLSLLLFGHA